MELRGFLDVHDRRRTIRNAYVGVRDDDVFGILRRFFVNVLDDLLHCLKLIFGLRHASKISMNNSSHQEVIRSC